VASVVKCPSCSQETSSNSRFCSSCGAAISSVSDQHLDETVAIPASSRTAASSLTATTRGPSSSSPDEGRFLAGTLIVQRYRVVSLLGRGGMGEVYRAYDLVLGQHVALKFLPESFYSDESALERFHGEVRISRQVSHPNVCRVYDIGEVDGQPYLSMEYVDGEDLGSLLRRIGRLPQDKAVELARKLCAGLAAAHDKGVIHRDLKPSNIMVDGRGEVLITDFGLAGIANQIQQGEIRHGTPAYMAPEQLAGKEVTIRSDIYSLGLVLYEMFSGKRAYEAQSMADLMRLQTETEPPSLTTLVQELDPAVERAILRCLDSDPRNRPASALAIAAALPGGNPLAVALAAGETPSPEMVALAGEREGLRIVELLVCLAVLLVSMAAVPFLAQSTAWITHTPFENSPDALALKARDILQNLGFQPKLAYSASGLSYDGDLISYLDKQGRKLFEASIKDGQPSPVVFWFRTSPRDFVADRMSGLGGVSFSNPSMLVSGATRMKLDASGRLVAFESVPPQIDETPAPAGDPDWSPLFTAAALDVGHFTSVTPRWTPAVPFDQRAAWTCSFPGWPPDALRVEAASWRGKPVSFLMIGPWSRPERVEVFKPSAKQKIGQAINVVLFVAIVIGAFLVARHNVRTGRGDRRGATRLGFWLVAVNLIAFLFETHHVADSDELGLLAFGMALCLLTGAAVWGLYVALEPYVRRHWPGMIISWTRMLSGRLRDPVVGGHILAGLAAGALLAVIIEFLPVLNMHNGAAPSRAINLSTLAGIRPLAGSLLDSIPGALTSALVQCFLLFLLRLLLRREKLAAAAFVVFMAVFYALLSSGSALIAVPIRLLQNILLVTILLRYGLVALAAAFFSVNLLITFPVTADFSTWYAGTTIFALSLLLVIAGLCFHTALAGRKLFKADLLDS
jgi:predicted Ser/Thr protein kinase